MEANFPFAQRLSAGRRKIARNPVSLVRSRLFLRTVPTALERSGDFSRTVVNVNGSPRALTLYDPFTVTPTGNNVWTRGLIPNGQIPATRLNAAAVKLFANYPLPNRTPDDLFNANNFPRSGTRQYDRNNLNSRFD